MYSALIGYTGFVGSNLQRQRPFDQVYNRSNIEEITGREFDLVVCAGAPAEKWRANQDPQADLAGIRRLQKALDRARAERAVLISTIDVYPEPCGVDEATAIDPDAGHAYGRHRQMLERFVADRFDTLVIRLPGLFGRGLKKNAVYDFLNDNQIEKIDSRAIYQFYGLDNLWGDIEAAHEAGLRLLNIATEPVRVDEVARHAFGIEFHNEIDPEPARYDMRSRHAEFFGGTGRYLQSRDQVLEELTVFVRSEREA